MTRRRTHEEFLLEVKNTHPNIMILGVYKNARTKIKCKCSVCGNEWDITPYDLLKGKGCYECTKKVMSNRLIKTTEQFIKELKEINPYIEILSEYKGNKKPIKCRCLIDNNIWETRPINLLRGVGCPKCGINKTKKVNSKNHEDFIIELKTTNPNINVLTKYTNAKTKVKCECVICGHIWESIPDNLLKGKGCPKCKLIKQSERQTKTHEEFTKEMKNVNPNISILTDYIGSQIKVDCKCDICGNRWSAKPSNLLQGKGCPKCCISNGEKRIMKYLDNNNISYIYDKPYFNDLFGLGGKNLRPDFIIEDIKLWIEFDGEFHYNDFYKDGSFETLKYHDKLKDEYAKEHNWKLTRIPYWEYDNIENILNEILNKNNEVK